MVCVVVRSLAWGVGGDCVFQFYFFGSIFFPLPPCTNLIFLGGKEKSIRTGGTAPCFTSRVTSSHWWWKEMMDGCVCVCVWCTGRYIY